MPKWLRRTLIAAAVLAAVVVAVRLALDPIATSATRRGLARLQGMHGDFERVHVTVFSPGYTITRLALTPTGSKEPIFFAESAHVGLDLGALLHRRLIARARLVEPKFTIIQPAHAPPKGTPAPPDLSAQLSQITPLQIARVEIVRGEILFRDDALPNHPELWVHHLALAAENLATRERLAGARPTTVSAAGVLGDSGKLSVFASADAFASPLEMAGRLELEDLRVAELYAFLEPKTKLQAPHGTLDVFAQFTVRDGLISGGVKPVLKNVEVKPAEPGAWDHVKAWLADTAVKLASDRVPDRNAVATTVPIKGKLTSPDVQLWPAIIGVVRNAFVEGLASGFANVPPPDAPKKQSKIEQAKAALEKSKGPPKAQPLKKMESRS
ncbi:MAG TPA: DUF748 domain-containing protein [Polyangia bacterium]|nr:DUF748 domain-containing protein [Polyangia bacterium]